MMLYHHHVTGIDQYESADNYLFLALHRFGLDIFQPNSRLKEQFKIFYATLFDIVLNTQAMQDVLAYFS